jgi:transcriptional regulator with XRE-family HTH domain
VYPLQWMKIADRMRAARVLANLSQQELADRLGVSVGTVKRRESGDSAASPEVLMALAQATGVPLAWIVGGFSEDQINEPLDVTLRRLPHPPLGLGDE